MKIDSVPPAQTQMIDLIDTQSSFAYPYSAIFRP